MKASLRFKKDLHLIHFQVNPTSDFLIKNNNVATIVIVPGGIGLMGGEVWTMSKFWPFFVCFPKCMKTEILIWGPKSTKNALQ